jgi:hypothetical protein
MAERVANRTQSNRVSGMMRISFSLGLIIWSGWMGGRWLLRNKEMDVVANVCFALVFSKVLVTSQVG